MKKFGVLAFTVIALAVSSCVSTPVSLQPGAEAVRVGKSDPPQNYEEVGPVTGVNGNGCGGFGTRGDYAAAVIDLKNRTYSMGANYAQIITIKEPRLEGGCYDNSYKINAMAYKN